MGLEELSGAEAKALFVVGSGSSSSDEKKKEAAAAAAEGREGEALEVRLARLEAENAALRA